jgi:hypothetical protein
MQFSFDLQIASQQFRFSKHEESKNRRLSWCFLLGGERIRTEEPSVEVISETSKNRRFS